MTRTNFKAKMAMEWAWREARRIQVLRGGSVRQYMSEALKWAWAKVKADPTVEAVEQLRAEILAGKHRTPWTGRRQSGYVFGCAQR